MLLALVLILVDLMLLFTCQTLTKASLIASLVLVWKVGVVFVLKRTQAKYRQNIQFIQEHQDEEDVVEMD